jgi:hypothetical protein
MGIELSAGANLGTVLAIRTSGEAGLLTGLPISPDSSIRWNWTIKPSVQPSTANRSLTLRWAAVEDNNRNLSALQVWKRSTQLDPWEEAGGIQTAGGNSTLRSVVWNNVNAFSQFTVGENNVPLSLDLLSFTAVREGKNARIEWEVALEGDALRYFLEKSSDGGKTFQVLESRQANPKDGRYLAYDYNFSSDSYYRIRVVRRDGAEDVSRAVFLGASSRNASGVVVPNPSASGIGIRLENLSLTERGEVELHILNAEGRLCLRIKSDADRLNAALLEQSADLPAGIYQIRILSDVGGQVLRFSRQ